MYESQITELEEEVHCLQEREKEAEAIAFEVRALRSEKEEMKTTIEEKNRELAKRTEECSSYYKAMKECIVRCEECARELRHAQNREDDHQAVVCELQVRIQTLFHVDILSHASSFWNSTAPTLSAVCSVSHANQRLYFGLGGGVDGTSWNQ